MNEENLTVQTEPTADEAAPAQIIEEVVRDISLKQFYVESISAEKTMLVRILLRHLFENCPARKYFEICDSLEIDPRDLQFFDGLGPDDQTDDDSAL